MVLVLLIGEIVLSVVVMCFGKFEMYFDVVEIFDVLKD